MNESSGNYIGYDGPHLVDISNNIYLVIDGAGVVVDVNERLCEMVGVAKQQLLGRNWLQEFVADGDKIEVQEFVASLGGVKRDGLLSYTNRIKSRSGNEFVIVWSFSLLYDKDGSLAYSVAFGLDQTALVLAQQQFSHARELVLFNPNPVMRLDLAGGVMTANSAAQQLLSDLAKLSQEMKAAWKALLAKLVSGSVSSYQQIDFGNSFFQFIAIKEQESDSYLVYGADLTELMGKKIAIRRFSETVPGAFYNYIFHADGSESIEFLNDQCEALYECRGEDIAGDPSSLWVRVHPDDLLWLREAMPRGRYQSDAWSYQFRYVTQSGIKWIRCRAGRTARSTQAVVWQVIAMDVTEEVNSRLSVEAARKNIITVLVKAMEYRDPYTAGHQERVARLAVLIAEAMALDAKVVMGLEMAARIHDLGKMQVPSEILAKPGELNAIERELISTHAQAGAEMLADIEFEWPIAQIVGQHHERWNGSGYPNKLTGEEILLEARILAVADSVESMTNHRPYRAALSIDSAIAELKKCAGILYDPQVVKYALVVLENEELNSRWLH